MTNLFRCLFLRHEWRIGGKGLYRNLVPYRKAPNEDRGVELFFRAGRERRYNGHVMLRPHVGRNRPKRRSITVFREAVMVPALDVWYFELSADICTSLTKRIHSFLISFLMILNSCNASLRRVYHSHIK
jgi:hypothetical protein